MGNKVIERQVIVTWYTPAEKTPEEGFITVVTVSGKVGGVIYDHTFALAEWYEDGLGWTIYGIDEPNGEEQITVDAWCDLEPYGGAS